MQLPKQLEFPKRVAEATMKDEVPDLAAGLAYRFLFAVFPFAIFLAALAGTAAQLAGLQDPSGQIVGSLFDNLPPDIAAQVRPQIDAILGNSRPGLISIGAVLALWAAMGGIGAVMKAMNRAYEVEETRGFALSQCSHDWILCLDDDECLSPEAVLFIDAELRALQQRVTYSTTIAGAKALLHSLDYRDSGPVWSLQELHKELES